MSGKKSQIAPIRHGLRSHPLYNAWSGMKDRCYNPNCAEYHNYGGRGVLVCEEWKNNFLSFYNWAVSNGWRRGLQVDKDKIGGGLLYSPDSCCLLTNKENNRLKPTKLNMEIALLIRSSNDTQRSLAKRYNVAKGVIQKIKENKIWV